MTVFQIEVRTRQEQHDAQAQRLAREILYLPPALLPSRAPTPEHPIILRSAQLYYLTGDLTHELLDQLIGQLLVDPVIQEARMIIGFLPPGSIFTLR